MFSKVEICNITNSSLNLAETKFYEVGLVPPCLLWVLQTLNLVCYLATPRMITRCLAQNSYLEPGYPRKYLSRLNSNMPSSKGWKRISANWEYVPLFTTMPACSFLSSHGNGMCTMSILWFRIAITSWIHSGIGLIYMNSFYPWLDGMKSLKATPLLFFSELNL